MTTERWTDDPQVQDDPDLGVFLARLSAEVPTRVDAATRQDTLQAMLTLASRPPTPAPTWRRRARRIAAFSSIKLVLVAGVATAGTTGGLAATGSLPAPVQSFVHDVAGHLGVGVPNAPGQVKDPGEPATQFAPGHLKGEGSARDVAPGRQRDGAAPGRSGDAPGRKGDVPADPQPDTAPPPDRGASDDAPGHTGETGPQGDVGPPADPGQPPGTGDSTGTGAQDDSTSDPDDAPGRSGSAPGHARDLGPDSAARQQYGHGTLPRGTSGR